MTKHQEELLAMRNQIDQIDQELVCLLNKRAECVLTVGKIKIKHEGNHVEFYCPEREAQILKKITEHNQGPLSSKSLLTIFRVVMTECRQLEIESSRL